MMQAGAVIMGSVLVAVAVQPLLAQDAPVADWLAERPVDELTAELLIARKIEARCRNLRLTPAAEAIIQTRGGELSDYLHERRFGPSEARGPAISAFEAKHKTTYAGTNSLCRAGYVEMKEGTPIGRLLQAK